MCTCHVISTQFILKTENVTGVVFDQSVRYGILCIHILILVLNFYISIVSTNQVIRLFVQSCLGHISNLENHWKYLRYTLIVHVLLFHSDMLTIIKQYILFFNQNMFSEFAFGIIATPFTQFCVTYIASCLRHKKTGTHAQSSNKPS